MPMGVDSVRTVLSAGYAEKVRLKGRHRREARGIVDAYQAEVGQFWGFVEPDRAVNVLPRTVDVELARRLRVQDQLAIAEYELQKAENEQQRVDLEVPGNRILAEMTESWTRRVRELQEALETGDLSVIDYATDSVPDYSAEAWAERVEGVASMLGLNLEDVVLALACMELRMRKIHQQRQLERAEGKSPYGLAELQEPEPWEVKLIDEMAQHDEIARVVEWLRISGLTTDVLPRPTAPLPSKEFLEHLAKQRRIRTQLEIAELKLEEAEQNLQRTRVEDPGDLVAAEIFNAWLGRVAALRKALETQDFGAVEAFADDEQVPGHSDEEWTRKVKALENKRLQAEMEDDSGAVSHGGHFNAANRGEELRGSAEPQAGAADAPSSGIQPEETPG